MSQKTLLIVEDSPTNVEILDELLIDFRKKVAVTGSKALELARTDDPPDLILLDLELPDISGFEICEQLKNDPLTQSIPIIFLTSVTDKDTTIKGFKLGASDFMTKPFNAEELIVRVKTQLDLAEAKYGLESTVRQMEISSRLLRQSGEDLARQNKIADDLLLNVLPESVARELRDTGQVAPRHFPVASVLFADLVGFSRISKSLSPAEIIDELNQLFTGFDLILEKNRIEKIKTVGDGYMAVGGIPVANNSNAIDAVKAGLEMVRFVTQIRDGNKKSGKPSWEVRIGIHTGELIAGVIGKNKFTYDVWGDTVNAASRVETAAIPGKVTLSGITYQLVKDKFKCARRGTVQAKNMGKMDIYECSDENP